MAAGATYEPIATQTLASAAATITFSSIAASWTDLRLVLVTTTSTANNAAAIRFNGDSATNYSQTIVRGSGTTAGSTSATSATYVQTNLGSAGTSTTIPTLFTFDVFSYAGSTNKTLLVTSNTDQNGSGGVESAVGLWRSTAAITSIVLSLTNAGNYSIGTTATLYGIRAA